MTPRFNIHETEVGPVIEWLDCTPAAVRILYLRLIVDILRAGPFESGLFAYNRAKGIATEAVELGEVVRVGVVWDCP